MSTRAWVRKTLLLLLGGGESAGGTRPDQAGGAWDTREWQAPRTLRCGSYGATAEGGLTAARQVAEFRHGSRDRLPDRWAGAAGVVAVLHPLRALARSRGRTAYGAPGGARAAFGAPGRPVAVRSADRQRYGRLAGRATILRRTPAADAELALVLAAALA